MRATSRSRARRRPPGSALERGYERRGRRLGRHRVARHCLDRAWLGYTRTGVNRRCAEPPASAPRRGCRLRDTAAVSSGASTLRPRPAPAGSAGSRAGPAPASAPGSSDARWRRPRIPLLGLRRRASRSQAGPARAAPRPGRTSRPGATPRRGGRARGDVLVEAGGQREHASDPCGGARCSQIEGTIASQSAPAAPLGEIHDESRRSRRRRPTRRVSSSSVHAA
jgi:hypothetical protein